MINDFDYLCHYRDNPDLLRRLFELIELAFPGLSLSDQERAARPLGCHWEKISTPFVYWDGERPVLMSGYWRFPWCWKGAKFEWAGFMPCVPIPTFAGEASTRL
jgi:hypothetical protein